jgi:hypothetical protein
MDDPTNERGVTMDQSSAILHNPRGDPEDGGMAEIEYFYSAHQLERSFASKGYRGCSFVTRLPSWANSRTRPSRSLIQGATASLVPRPAAEAPGDRPRGARDAVGAALGWRHRHGAGTRRSDNGQCRQRCRPRFARRQCRIVGRGFGSAAPCFLRLNRRLAYLLRQAQREESSSIGLPVLGSRTVGSRERIGAGELTDVTEMRDHATSRLPAMKQARGRLPI